jgi:hypothetical protein
MILPQRFAKENKRSILKLRTQRIETSMKWMSLRTFFISLSIPLPLCLCDKINFFLSHSMTPTIKNR